MCSSQLLCEERLCCPFSSTQSSARLLSRASRQGRVQAYVWARIHSFLWSQLDLIVTLQRSLGSAYCSLRKKRHHALLSTPDTSGVYFNQIATNSWENCRQCSQRPGLWPFCLLPVSTWTWLTQRASLVLWLGAKLKTQPLLWQKSPSSKNADKGWVCHAGWLWSFLLHSVCQAEVWGHLLGGARSSLALHIDFGEVQVLVVEGQPFTSTFVVVYILMFIENKSLTYQIYNFTYT